MDKLFEKIARFSPIIKIAVLFGAVLLLFGGFYLGLAGGSSAKGDEARERANLKRAKQEYAAAEEDKDAEKRTCEKMRKGLKKATRKMRKFQGMLPNQPSISQLIMDLKSKLSGLVLEDYARRPEVSRGVYAEIPLDLTVRGPFHQAVKFFHEVSLMARIVNIADVSFEDAVVTAGKTHMKIRFTVSTFRYVSRAIKRGKGGAGKKKKT